MKNENRLKWLKYAVKGRILGTVPGAYWGARSLFKGPLEAEMALLPSLCKPDQNVLDVGANWGAYGFRCSQLARHVHCFEPQPRLAKILRHGLGRKRNVTVHGCALSDRTGTADIRIPRNDIGYSTIEKENILQDKVDLSRGIETVSVPTERLDDLDLGNVAFIKIDVEGHELSVLSGGLNLLRSQKPAILVESEERHRPGVVEEVEHLLQEIGYSAWIMQQGELQPFKIAQHSGRNLIFRCL